MGYSLAIRSGGHVLVDAHFADWLLQCWGERWAVRRDTHGQRRPLLMLPYPAGKWTDYRLARLVSRAPPNLFPKHLNGDVMDCRRANLALVRSRGEAGR